jgi:ribonuclease R
MVTKEQVLEFMRLDAYRPLTLEELVEAFEIKGQDEFQAFVRLLGEMEEAGEIVQTRTHRYGLPERMNLVVGRLEMKARGYGFVIPNQPGQPDVYIPASEINGAMPGDKVMARIERSGAGPRLEGRIIRVLERVNDRVVGKFTRHRDHGFVTPTDKRFPQDIYIGPNDMMDAHDGYMVVVEITSYPTPTRGPEGRIVEVLGHPDAPGIDILTVVRKYRLPEEFPEEVLRAAEAIPLELSEKDYEGRRDLRNEVIVTIDGDDAKDLDDAVHVKRLENGNYLLGVHIADVGYYVKEGSVIDREAFKRGTSVYLVDRVIPMLPQRLSNIICSLNPHVDRLTMTCEMEFNPRGELVRHDIYPSVIRTTERMTYTNVRKILEDRDPELMARYAELVPHFELMRELALILREKRMARGAIDFDFNEVKVYVDDLGHPTAVVPRRRSIAERIIEEFMLAANETIAEHFHWLNVPFLYRVHEEPDMERMLEFNEFIHNFGYHVKGVGNRVHPKALQELLEKIEGTREENVISKLMLRSMKQARYSPECLGHFGLAADYYTHFTSPIRRYPDLVIHRIIREVLEGKLTEEREERLRAFVDEAAVQSSERERIADEAERECDQLKMVEYMMDHIGEEFDGIISGVTQFGLFVELENGIEGLIHVSYLTDDYYALNDKQMALVGERTRRVFRLGDPVRVRVIGANKEELQIDFELVAHLREGTMVYEGGRATVVYDEDLSPRARRIAEAQRARLARRPKSREARRGDGSTQAAGMRRGAVRDTGRGGYQAPPWQVLPGGTDENADPWERRRGKSRKRASRRGADPVVEALPQPSKHRRKYAAAAAAHPGRRGAGSSGGSPSKRSKSKGRRRGR